MLTGPSSLASISPTVLFTGSGDKQDFLKCFLLSLSQYPFNVYNSKIVKTIVFILLNKLVTFTDC